MRRLSVVAVTSGAPSGAYKHAVGCRDLSDPMSAGLAGDLSAFGQIEQADLVAQGSILLESYCLPFLSKE